MKHKFLNYFYSTRKTVSMMELTNTKQWKDEPVVDYINHWCSLSLDCKDRLFEVSIMGMCIQGMYWGLLYILQGIQPRTFEELATRANDIVFVIKTNISENMSIKKLENDIIGGQKLHQWLLSFVQLLMHPIHVQCKKYGWMPKSISIHKKDYKGMTLWHHVLLLRAQSQQNPTKPKSKLGIVERIYSTVTSPFLTISQSKWYFLFMCFFFKFGSLGCATIPWLLK